MERPTIHAGGAVVLNAVDSLSFSGSPQDGGMRPLRHNGEVKQAPHRTITRRWDEPKLEIGDPFSIEEGLVGVILARYTRAGYARHDVHYIVELRREAEQH